MQSADLESSPSSHPVLSYTDGLAAASTDAMLLIARLLIITRKPPALPGWQ